MQLLHRAMDAKWLGRVDVQSVAEAGSAQQACAGLCIVWQARYATCWRPSVQRLSSKTK